VLQSKPDKSGYEYQRTGRYFIQVAGSLERLARAELLDLGANIHTEVPRGFFVSCNLETLYRIIYTSRLCQRALAPTGQFSRHSGRNISSPERSLLDWTSCLS
jgi:23S rRNA G2445 N2-methylase RlmL